MPIIFLTSPVLQSAKLPSRSSIPTFPPSSAAPVASETPAADPLLPTPEPSQQDLATQISSLRAELRDKRIAQGTFWKRLKLQAVEIKQLKAELETAGRAHEGLGLKLTQEQNKTKAVERKFEVAVANHASAVDKLTRIMPELEELRLAKEQGELCWAREKHGYAEQLKELELEKSTVIQALRKDLKGRDDKIQRLQSELHRQREINAMFTIDYDHDTTFTRRLSVPLRVTLPTGQTIPTPEPTPPGKQRQYRLPLVDLEDNQGIQGKKRTYSAHDESESSGPLPTKINKLGSMDTLVKPEHQVSHMRGGLRNC